MTKIEVGSELYIRVSVATAHCRVASSGVFGKVGAMTDKAIRLDAYTEKNEIIQMWFPRKALVNIKKVTEPNLSALRADLAVWFNPGDSLIKKISKVQYTSILTE